MAKTLTIYPNGAGRNGQRHLSEKETAVELYHISFKVGKDTFRIFPEKLTVTIGGERHGKRLDLLLADMLSNQNRIERRLAEYGKALASLRNTHVRKV